MTLGRPEHTVTITVPYGTNNLWVQQQLSRYPGDATLSIHQEQRTNSPVDPGGETTIRLVWNEK